MREKQCPVTLGFKFPQGIESSQQRETDRKHSRRLSALAGAWVFSTAWLAFACAAQPARTAPAPSAAKINAAPPSSAELARTVVTADSATDISELFAKATAEGQAKHYQ